MRMYLSAVFAALVGASGLPAHAATMYVHDADGWLGKVDTTTGSVDLIGEMPGQMTDIAFDPDGNLYALTFTGLFVVDKTTAGINFIGNHGIAGGNALVFGADGTLYGAGNNSNNLFVIDPATAASVSLGSMGFSSGGDLAFVGEQLYMASGSGQLVSVDVADPALSSALGFFGVPNVFGIATAENELYAVGGTSIFKVDLATGAAINPVSFAGQGLIDAYGQSFYSESGATPEEPIACSPSAVRAVALGVALDIWSYYPPQNPLICGATPPIGGAWTCPFGHVHTAIWQSRYG